MVGVLRGLEVKLIEKFRNVKELKMLVKFFKKVFINSKIYFWIQSKWRNFVLFSKVLS